MRLIPRLALIAATAAVAFPLAYWMTETFHLDCTRTSRTAFKCIAERTKRGDTRLFALDETSLTGARTDRETHIDPQDNSVNVSYHLTLIQPGDAIISNGGDRADIEQRVLQVKSFLGDPTQPTLRFTHNNRTLNLLLAAFAVFAAALLTHDFSYKPSRKS